MEVEAKYSVPDGEVFNQLLALDALGAHTLRDAGTQTLLDHYLDTPQRSILQGGYALRLRATDGQPLHCVTVKALGGRADGALHQREEYELEIEPATPPADWPPGPARDIVLKLAPDEPPVELFTVRQKRHSRWVCQDERRAADLSLDEVTLVSSAGEQLTYELEIELTPAGTVDDLHACEAALAGFPLEPQAKSKFKRGLALLDAQAQPPEEAKPERPKTPGVRADESMGEAGRKVLRFHFDKMLDKEAGARSGTDLDSVHDMRVATRRQRAALRLFESYYKRKWVRPVEQGLKELARLLGAVRDLDVQLEAARAYQAALPPEAAPAFQTLLDAWGSDRDAARLELLAYLDGKDYRQFKKAYTRFLDSRPTSAGLVRDFRLQPVIVRHVLPGRLWEHYGAVRAYEAALPGAPVETLHALRIESKRLRYALEFFEEILDPAIGDAIQSVVALQDHLGELHDADVCRARLQAFLDQLGPDPAKMDARRAVWAYLNTQQSRLRSLLRSAGRPWRAIMRRRIRHVLARAVARL